VFTLMGTDGFADRTKRELFATGEKVLKRRDDTRDALIPGRRRSLGWLEADARIP